MLYVVMKAGEALSKGDVVYVSGDKEVKKASASEAAKVIGVADGDVPAGALVPVIVYGVARVIADEAISAGDRVRAASTAGRVAKENTIPTHTHSNPNISVTAGVSALTADLGHNNSTGALETTAADSVGIAQPDTNPSSAGDWGRILGKALESAAGAGRNIEILVCLA